MYGISRFLIFKGTTSKKGDMQNASDEIAKPEPTTGSFILCDDDYTF